MNALPPLEKGSVFRSLVGKSLRIVGVCALLVLGVELAGQGLFRLKEGRWLFRGQPLPLYGYAFEQHPYLVGIPRSGGVLPLWGKKVTFTGNRTRWTGGSTFGDDKIRVVCLGGSTTFGAYASDDETWPAQLQMLLGDRYAVYNYGMLGYTTAENIIQMALLIPEIKPDIVVFYTGWDDIANYHRFERSPDYVRHGFEQFENLKILDRERTAFAERLADRSGTIRLIQFVKNSFGTQKAEPAEKTDVFTGPDLFVDHIYRRNLETLRELAFMHGSFALFVPQVLNETAFESGRTLRSRTPRLEDAAVPALMDHLNGQMKGLCDGTICEVVDDVDHVAWPSSYFVDEGHFNNEGGRAFAELMARHIRARAR